MLLTTAVEIEFPAVTDCVEFESVIDGAKLASIVVKDVVED
jgi:hypothetical protein